MIELVQSGVVFTDNPHSYHLDGKELRGVTGIISEYVIRNKYFNVSDEVLERAAIRGSRIHEQCRACDKIGIIASDEVKHYVDIKKTFGLTTVENEYTVSDNVCVASKIDLVAHRDGDDDDEFVIADFKTTSHLDIEYLSWQLSIYKYLFELQNPNAKAVKLLAIWLPLAKYGKPRGEYIPEKPKEEIERLLNAVCNNEEYTPTELSVPPSVLMLQNRCYDTLLRLKEAEEEKARIIDALNEAMTQYDIKKWETDSFIVTRVLPSQRETFNSKKFKTEHPDLYDMYKTTSAVKGSIKLTLKK